MSADREIEHSLKICQGLDCDKVCVVRGRGQSGVLKDRLGSLNIWFYG